MLFILSFIIILLMLCCYLLVLLFPVFVLLVLFIVVVAVAAAAVVVVVVFVISKFTDFFQLSIFYYIRNLSLAFLKIISLSCHLILYSRARVPRQEILTLTGNQKSPQECHLKSRIITCNHLGGMINNSKRQP